MKEWPTASQLILEARNSSATCSFVLVIFSAHGEADAGAGRHYDASRPDLDVQLDDLAGSQRLLLIVSVIRPGGSAQLAIKLAMRSPEPALCDRSVRIDRALKYNLLSIRREGAKHEEDVGVCRRG